MLQKTKAEIKKPVEIKAENVNVLKDLSALADKALKAIKKRPSSSYRGFKSAKYLGLSRKQRWALIETLKAMESGQVQHVNLNAEDKIRKIKKYLFNMEDWKGSYDCGTVACIGGTAELIAKAPIFENGELPIVGDLRELFYSGGVDNDVTPKQAAKALRGYLKTGKTDWEAVLGSKD
jgi:hypothetical protein